MTKPTGRPRGRPVTTGRGDGIPVFVRFTPTEHTLILSALAPAETPAGFLRAAGIRAAKQRTKRKVK